MNKLLFTIGLLFISSVSLVAQEMMNGIVKDGSGKPLSGVKVSKVGEYRNNNVTDEDGLFSLLLKKGDYIELNYADVATKRIKITGDTLNLVFDIKKDAVVDLGFLKRTEDTQTQSVTAIYADLLEKNATSPDRVNNALFGLISGLHLTQTVGWDANAGMNIRGRGGLGSGAPLVLVDGFERGLTNMTIEEIESVQVLKDGAATALMGARGANGVILVNTKRGIYN